MPTIDATMAFEVSGRIIGGLTSGETLAVSAVQTLREDMKVAKIQY